MFVIAVIFLSLGLLCFSIYNYVKGGNITQHELALLMSQEQIQLLNPSNNEIKGIN